MSIILTLLILFLSLHSCNARLLGVAHNGDAHSISNQENDEKKMINGGGRHVLISENSAKDAETEKTSTVNHHVKRDSSVSKKSFKVAHKKRGEEEEAGFNLDYLPPKTHPPSHN